MEKKNAYIAEIQSILPRRYSAKYVADRMYPSNLYGDRLNQLAKKLAYRYGVDYRTSVVDFERFPEIRLAEPADHPRSWGISIVDKLTTNIEKTDIGLFSLSYNMSFHTDVLPNLASQIAMGADLKHLDKNEEIAYYGCAAGIISLFQAVEYCREFERPAIVFTFDQCLTQSIQLDKGDPDFKRQLVSNLLFTDGGVGILVIPERMRNCYTRPLLRVTDIVTKFRPGNLIHMKNRKFLMSSDLKDVLPRLVSDILVRPFLTRNRMGVVDVDEWSVHQGGSKIITRFCEEDCLSLSQEQIERSLQYFLKLGNTSAASCLLVLESFFDCRNSLKATGTRGMVVGFGAGYYLGALLYEWD